MRIYLYVILVIVIISFSDIFCLSIIYAQTSRNNNLTPGQLNDQAKKLLSVDPGKSVSFSRQALVLAKKNNNQEDEAYALVNIGLYYFKISEMKKALGFYSDAEVIFNRIHDTIGFAGILINKGLVYDSWGDFNKSLQYYTKALEIFQKREFKPGISNCLVNISRIYFNMKNYEKSLELLNRNLIIEQDRKDTNGIASTLNNMAVILSVQGHSDNAIEIYFRVLNLYQQMNNQDGIAGAMHNIGNLYLLKNNFTASEKYLLDALNLSEENKNFILISETNYLLAELYFKYNRTDKALNLVFKSEEQANVQNNNTLLLSCYKLISEIYESKNDLKNSLIYYKKYKSISDSIFSSRMQQQLSDFQVKYETEDKEKQISILSKERKIQQLTINRQYILIVLFIVITLLLFAVAFLLYRSHKMKVRTNKILKTANDDLFESNAVKDKIFSVVVHELKNPVEAFYGVLNLLIDNYKSLDEKQKDNLLQKLNTSAKGMTELMQNISQWSLIKKDKHIYCPEEINLSEIASNAMDILSASAEKKGIILINEISEEILLQADKKMLFTVFCNLLTNAIKFSNPGGVVKVISTVHNNKVEVKIVDHGIGISKENLSKLLRIDSHHTTMGTINEKGTGLGLLICKDFVEKCGGTIRIESELNSGTIVILLLPVNR